MNNFANSTIAFAVITYYPKWHKGKLRSIKHTDKIRGDLTIEFIKKATKLGFQVVASDGKSSKTFRKTISEIPGLTLTKRHSSKRSVGIRQAIKKASTLLNVKVIVLTESEKISILDSIDKLTKPILESKADIIIPKRNPNLFQATFPSYMYDSEVEGNKLYNEILRTNNLRKEKEDLDLFFGPRVIANKKAAVRLFTKRYHLIISKNAYLDSYFDHEDYSSTQFFPVVEALKNGLKVKPVEINFTYPSIQKQNEMGGDKSLFEEKRKFQRMSILIELLYFLSSQKN